MTAQFRVGSVYFRVKYAERARKYPLIESLVFLGTNLSDEDHKSTWYFQFADSYARFGSVLEGPSGDRRVSCLGEQELSDMMSLDALIKELEAAQQRSESSTGK